MVPDQLESALAEDSDLEKTESATPRRLDKAREEGQVARSRELATFALVAAGFLGAWAMSDMIGEHVQTMLRTAFTFNHDTVFDQKRALASAGTVAREGGFALTVNTDPVKVEHDLMAIIPKKDWTIFSHRMIFHGRQICFARKPACDRCALNDVCPKVGVG